MKPVLITAGATRNPIDSMRYISAHATGKTGATIASSLMHKTKVFALCSPVAEHNMPASVETAVFESTDDLMGKMKFWVEQHPESVVIHSAAVGDYEVQRPSTTGKIPSGQKDVTILLQPTPKILDHIQQWSTAVRVVSFKAAAPNTTHQELESIAKSQLVRSNSAMVFANTIGNIDRGIMLVGPDKTQFYDTREHAVESLTDHVLALLGAQ